MTKAEKKEIILAVAKSDQADWKIRELAFKYLGSSEGRIDTVKEALYDLLILKSVTPAK